MPYTIAAESFESLDSAWRRLLPQCPTNTIFLTPQWQRLWWRQLGKEGDLWLLGLRNDAGVQGIAPLMRRQDTLTFLGNTDLVDYHDFIVRPEAAAPFFSTLATYLGKAEWGDARLESIPHGALALSHLPAALQAHNLEVGVIQEDVAPRVLLPATWEEYLASLGRKDRHELRRKLRRLEAAGQVRHYAITDAAELPSAMDDFLRLLRDSREEKSQFMTAEREGFFRAMAQELMACGIFRLYFMELDGARVAAAICMDYQATRLLYNSGYDPAYASLSVGLLLKALCVRDAIEAGMRYFDFLRGPERYKYHLGAVDVPLYTMRIRRA